MHVLHCYFFLDEETDASDTTEKPADLVLILVLAGLGTLIIIVVVVVILVKKCNRVHYQIKDAKETIEMAPQSAEPLPKKAFEDETGNINPSYQ